MKKENRDKPKKLQIKSERAKPEAIVRIRKRKNSEHEKMKQK